MGIWGSSAINGIPEWVRIDNVIRSKNGNKGMQVRRSYGSSWPSSFESSSIYGDYNKRISAFTVSNNFAQMAAGDFDNKIETFVNDIPNDHTVYLGWSHEPEIKGAPADFKNGWARFAQVVLNTGQTHVIPALCLMAYTFQTYSGRNPENWNPGPLLSGLERDACVMGVDGYAQAGPYQRTPNWLFDHPWDVFRNDWGFDRVSIMECGVNNESVGRKDWMRALETHVNARDVEVVCWWHSELYSEDDGRWYYLKLDEPTQAEPDSIQVWADIIARNQDDDAPVVVVPPSELPDPDDPPPGGGNTGGSTPIPTQPSPQFLGADGAFAGMDSGRNNDANMNLGIFSGTEELAYLDLEGDVLDGFFSLTNVGELVKFGDGLAWVMVRSVSFSPTAVSEIYYWRITWDGAATLTPLETGASAINPYTWTFSTAMRPLWIADSQQPYVLGNGLYLVQIENYIVNNGPPSNFNRTDDNRVVLLDAVTGDYVGDPVTVLAGYPTSIGQRWSRYNWMQVGDDSVVVGGTYVGEDDWRFIIITAVNSQAEVVEVATGWPEASQKLIPVSGWTDKFLVAWEQNYGGFSGDWTWNYAVVELDGTVSNTVTIEVAEVEVLVEGEPYLGDIPSGATGSEWTTIGGGGSGGQPMAQYIKWSATGDPDAPPDYEQIWTASIRRQALTYSNGVLALSGDPVVLTSHNPYDAGGHSDNEWPNFIAAGSSWTWTYGPTLDDFPDEHTLKAYPLGPGAEVSLFAGHHGFLDQPVIIVDSQIPNLAGEFESRERVFPRGPTTYSG